MKWLSVMTLLLLTVPLFAASEQSQYWNESPYYRITRIFETNSPAVGKPLPELTIHDRLGHDFRLRSLKGSYTVIVFGCLTCPNFLERIGAFEGLRHDYEPKGVKFYFVYKSLAHFERNGYVSPFTLQERIMHIRQAEKRLDTQIPWLCDTMDNAMSHHMGRAPNSEFIIDPDGRIVRKRAWSNPKIMRNDLIELIGAVANPTIPKNQYYQFKPPPKVAPSGLVKRAESLRHLRPLIVKPVMEKDALPFYAKLRVDADPEFLAKGEGKSRLYLGFFLDPIHRVHWNNRAAPIRVEFETPIGMELQPMILKGPQPKHAADVDPREFLVDIKASDLSKPFKVTVHYYACNDDEGWCLPLTQRYVVHLKRDPDGGKPLGRMLHH